MTTPDDPSGDPRRRRALVVDDDDALLRAHGRALVKGGYEVELADDGQVALRALARTSFDVILSDVDMPGMSGLTLLERVRDYDLDVPVVLITGKRRDRGRDRDSGRAGRAGASRLRPDARVPVRQAR